MGEFAKHCRTFYSSNTNSSPFSLVHSYVWGPTPVTFLFGYCYFVTFGDDYFNVTWVYLLKSKHEVFSTFQLFHEVVETQFDCIVKITHFDNDGEYLSYAFTSYLS